MVIIGAGTAGLVAAAGAAGLGAKVALVERELMGGDCLNVGCVPSKALISAARVARVVRYADELGVQVPGGTTVDFARVMQRMRQLRAEISPNDSAARFRDLGIDVYLGQGAFVDSNTVQVGDQRLESHDQQYDEAVDKLLVAVGRAPNVENLGLESVGVDFDKQGVKVNDRLQTTNPNIFAAGDIGSPYKFTHAADFMARIVIQNALFKGRAKASSLTIPWSTYTSPEVAHVDSSMVELSQATNIPSGIEVDVIIKSPELTALQRQGRLKALFGSCKEDANDPDI